MRGLLMVGAARIGEPYLAAARRLGFRVTLVESTAHQDRLAGEVDRFIPVTGTAEEHWAAAAQAAAGEEEPDGVLAFAETQVMAAALVQDRLGLPGPSLRAAVISRNKALQRAHFAAACLPQPDHLLVDNVEDAVAWAESRLPVVVKPLSLSGSRGVVAVGSTAELAGLLPERLAVGKVLLEQQAVGPEYSWEGILREGTILFGNVTAKETTGPPEFVEVAHRAGCHLDPAVDELVHGVIEAIGVRSGIVHLEFILTGDGPVAIEVAVRTPGDCLMDVLALTHGFDPYEAVVSVAMGDPVALPSGPVAHGAIWFPEARPGTVTAIEGADVLAEHPHIIRVRLLKSVGDQVAGLVSSAQRVGYLLFQAPSAADLETVMTEARKTFEIRTEP
ncbi:ATP-grasp domain-containing protein [Saccharothrix sp. AJ9571]|nr:ATP-grasp domain-containing protein [Saccharothrix sp. AJ9571]